jgi:hypothetical protein
MVSMRPPQLLRSATKALRNSIANTAASSANLLCETFERFFLPVLRNSNWSVASESGYSRRLASTLTRVHRSRRCIPGGCPDPGVNGNDSEAILDAEWASAAAPSAGIQLVSCADTATDWGGLIAFQNILNQRQVPSIISNSYGIQRLLQC